MSHKIKIQHAINQATLTSNVKEVISTILNSFLFFYKKISSEQKAQNAHKRTKIKKTAFYVLKRHLRGKKLLIRLFAFLFFLCFCAFCAFSTFCTLCAFSWLRFCAFCPFACLHFCACCACEIFS